MSERNNPTRKPSQKSTGDGGAVRNNNHHNNKNMDDIRRHRRQTLRVLVDYRCESGVCCDYATTLGAGGMFLETEQFLTPGSPIKVRFRLREGEALHEIEGRVAWRRAAAKPGEAVHAAGVGIQFEDPLATSRLARELEDFEL